MVEQIVGLLKQNPEGLRAEQIRQSLGLQAKELPRPLKEALDSGLISSSGQKRATTYVLKGKASKRGARGAGAKRSARRAPPTRKRRGKPGKPAKAGKAANGTKADHAVETKAAAPNGAPAQPPPES